MKKVALIVGLLLAGEAMANDSKYIEVAALMHVAMKQCGIAPGDGPGVVDYVAMAAVEMNITPRRAGRLADLKYSEIMQNLTKQGKLVKFCKQIERELF